jgi:hypothetical protein
LQKVHVINFFRANSQKINKIFDVKIFLDFFGFIAVSVLLSDGSSKTLQRTFYKKIVSKSFYKKIDKNPVVAPLETTSTPNSKDSEKGGRGRAQNAKAAKFHDPVYIAHLAETRFVVLPTTFLPRTTDPEPVAFLRPYSAILAVGWPPGDPGGPRNQFKNLKKQEGVPKWPKICADMADIECKRYT